MLAIDRARMPGFSEASDGFRVDKYQVDKSTWTQLSDLGPNRRQRE